MPPSCALISTAPGREKSGEHAIGRSRGGLTAKIHALVDALGNPVELLLTPGQAPGLGQAEPLIEDADFKALLADRAYDADRLIDTLAERQITPVIPPKVNRTIKRACDFALYAERNLIERFLDKLKHSRTIATRHGKPDRNFLVAIHLAAIVILLN